VEIVLKGRNVYNPRIYPGVSARARIPPAPTGRDCHAFVTPRRGWYGLLYPRAACPRINPGVIDIASRRDAFTLQTPHSVLFPLSPPIHVFSPLLLYACPEFAEFSAYLPDVVIKKLEFRSYTVPRHKLDFSGLGGKVRRWESGKESIPLSHLPTFPQ